MASLWTLAPHFTRHALAYDSQGRLWVRTGRGEPGTTVFDVFAPDDAFLGERQVDESVGTYAIAQGILVGVATHPTTEVQRVMRWEIRESG